MVVTRIEPLDGQQFLSKEDADKAAPNYLMDELPARLQKDAVKYRISVQVADAGDPVNDGTISWPETRKIVELGILTIKTADPDGVKFEKSNMYSPLALVDGIEPSDDPILLARPVAYAISYGRRVGQITQPSFLIRKRHIS